MADRPRPDFRAGEELILEHGDNEWLPVVAESEPFEDRFGWHIWLQRCDDRSKRIQASANIVFRDSPTLRRFIAIGQMLERAQQALWATDPTATEFSDLLRNGSPEAEAVSNTARAYNAAWQTLNSEQPRP